MSNPKYIIKNFPQNLPIRSLSSIQNTNIGEYVQLDNYSSPIQHLNSNTFTTVPTTDLAVTPRYDQGNLIYESNYQELEQDFDSVEKTYYSEINKDLSNTEHQFYTTTDGTTVQTHPNTILITNNYTPQTKISSSLTATEVHSNETISGLNQNNFNNNAIRIITTHNNNYNHQPQVQIMSENVNNNNGKRMSQEILTFQQLPQHRQSTHLQPQDSQFHLQQIQVPHNISQQSLFSLPSYISRDSRVQHSNEYIEVSDGSEILLSAAESRSPAPAVTSSALVLDRINICINNHYKDVSVSGMSPAHIAQTSPIIPAIKHKLIEKLDGIIVTDSFEIMPEIVTMVDEPDSTTTPNTPPTTPETLSPAFRSVSTETSPPKDSSSIKTNTLNIVDIITIPASNVTSIYKNKESNKMSSPLPTAQAESLQSISKNNDRSTSPISPTPQQTLFFIGEDVFLKRYDRFYLGNVIDSHCQQYLIRFDDESEFWSNVDELKKLTINTDMKPMCVGCKRSDISDIVEVCERCGRGFHRRCTKEISPSSKEWFCKRLVYLFH